MLIPYLATKIFSVTQKFNMAAHKYLCKTRNEKITSHKEVIGHLNSCETDPSDMPRVYDVKNVCCYYSGIEQI